ncbi:MAG: SDR family oxidoreductase [Paenarthrobacter sp.]
MTKSAIITGGTGGMGIATAKILGKDHRIVLADRDQGRLDTVVSELSHQGIEAIGTICDITDRTSLERVFDIATRGEHTVRAVVHTAGVSPQMGTAEFVTHINAIGTVNVTQAFLARAGEGDALVNVASVAGHGLPRVLVPFGAFPLAEEDPAAFERVVVRRARVAGRKRHSGLAYAISKAFVIWYSQHRAATFGTRGARILSVSPGSFDTPMGYLEKDHGAADLLKTSAIKRFGQPEEIAAVLAFCAGEAPGYLTGTDILVDGGTRAGTAHTN